MFVRREADTGEGVVVDAGTFVFDVDADVVGVGEGVECKITGVGEVELQWSE